MDKDFGLSEDGKILYIDGEEHEVGNEYCDACWYNKTIKCECGSLIHSYFVDCGLDYIDLGYQCENEECSHDARSQVE